MILSHINDCGSRYSVSSVVMVSPLDQSESVLAEIQYLLWCDVSCADSNIKSYCFVAAPYYMQHPARVWFGTPAQVWAAVPILKQSFHLLLTSIQDRHTQLIRQHPCQHHFTLSLNIDLLLSSVSCVFNSCYVEKLLTIPTCYSIMQKEKFYEQMQDS